MAYSRVEIQYEFPAGVKIVAEKSDEAMYQPAEKKVVVATATDPTVGIRRVQWVISRVTERPGFAEDVAIMTMDFMKHVTGTPNDTWNAADFDAVEAHLDTYWSAIKNQINESHVLDQFRWYRIGPKVVPPTQPSRITEKNTAGTSTTSALPPQVAISVTEKTPVRRCWGRHYIPGATVTTIETPGVVLDATVDQICNAANAMYQATHDAGYWPVVYSKTRAKAFAIESVQVDDLYDVIRRRRFDRPSYKKALGGIV